MRKAKYWGTIFTLFTLIFSSGFIMPASALAATSDATTTMSRSSDSSGNVAPVVQAKWEMEAGTQGEDASSQDGAQFTPPGDWGDMHDYSVCAIVTDSDGTSDISGVYADVYYPEDIAFHMEDSSMDGCGDQKGTEIELNRLSKSEGLDLFCNSIKNNNNSLPSFYGEYGYNDICDEDGDLQKETAYVYCGDDQLKWEDPAGDYRTTVMAQDSNSAFSNILENTFEYEPLTAFETDFDTVDYGNVKLNTHKKISGDLSFEEQGGSDRPTVRNTGNTRLKMGIIQDDMGLGKTGDDYNVRYDARVGNDENAWKDYAPEHLTYLNDILGLSQTEEMDFSILVNKFPSDQNNWSGDMTLSAKSAPFLACDSDPIQE